MNMEIEPFLLASSITGALGLRLIRKNCPHCAQPYTPEPGVMRYVPVQDRETAQFQKGVGCDHCGSTGYIGRVAVAELLTVDQVFRDAILQKLPTKALQEVAITTGMRTLWRRGLQHALTGGSPLEEILRVVAVDEL